MLLRGKMHVAAVKKSMLLRWQVHVGWLEGGTAVFAFRGTATAQDGLQDVKIFSKNIDYLQELYPGVKAHLGGSSALQCLSVASALLREGELSHGGSA